MNAIPGYSTNNRCGSCVHYEKHASFGPKAVCMRGGPMAPSEPDADALPWLRAVQAWAKTHSVEPHGCCPDWQPFSFPTPPTP